MFELVFTRAWSEGLHGPGTLPQEVLRATDFLKYRSRHSISSWQKIRSRLFGQVVNPAGFCGPLFRRYNFNPGCPLYSRRSDTHIISYEVL